MIEILGNNLLQFFETVEVIDEGVIARSYKGKDYEVWSVYDSMFDHMSNMSEEEFISLAGEDAWWRWQSGSIFGYPEAEYEINGQKLMAWDSNRREDYLEECEQCSDRIDGLCKGTKTDFEECFPSRKYSSLTEYLCEEMGASQPRNVCALAVDLAKYNNMTLGELFSKYEG